MLTMGRRPTTHEEVHKKKLLDTTTYLKNAGWHSTNNFVLNHYNSPASASQSLRLQPKSTTYSSDTIMAAWLANVPSGPSKKELHRSITRHASHIMVNESTAAYHNEKLCLSSSGLVFRRRGVLNWLLVIGLADISYERMSPTSCWTCRARRGICSDERSVLISCSVH
jgi:hypothetical protein